jgi:chromosome segregation ATPase
VPQFPKDLMTEKRENTVPATEISLSKALKKNQEAVGAVEEVADELGVVHAVLSAELADVAAEGDFESVVARTKTLEGKLSDTVEKMEEVNRALAEQRASIEHLSNAK